MLINTETWLMLNQNIHTFSTQCLESPPNHSYQFLRANHSNKQTTPVSYPKHHPLNSCASGNQTTTTGNTIWSAQYKDRFQLMASTYCSPERPQRIFKLPDQELTLFLPSRERKSASAELTLAQGR